MTASGEANSPRLEELQAEIRELRGRLTEAEDTLRAIREQEVDAIIVTGSQGEQVFSLTGSDHVYRLIVETMKDAALTVTVDGRILFCNQQFGCFVQTPLERIVGRSLAEFVPADESSIVSALLVASQQASIKRRLVFQTADGALVPAHVSTMLLQQQDGPSICLVATDLRELESSAETLRLLRIQQEALAQSEQRYRELVELSPEAILVHRKGRVVYANQAGCRLFGAEKSTDLVGRDIVDLVHPDHRKPFADRMRQILGQEGIAPLSEYKLLRMDRQVVEVDVLGSIIRYEGQPAVQVIFRDMSLRKRIEETLRALNADLERRIREGANN